MNLQAWLRRIMRYVLPFLCWRVPVRLLRGVAPGTGRQVVLLSAGSSSGFIDDRLFTAESGIKELRSTHVPIWRLQRLLDAWAPQADLVVVEVDRLSARWFLPARYLPLPHWVNSWLKTPSDWAEFGRTHRSAQGDIRRVRIKNFECEVSHDPRGEVNEFYDRYFVPYMRTRHGQRACINARWVLRLLLRQGLLLWIRHNGVRVSGNIVKKEGRRLILLVNGVLDGREDLMNEGALSAQYVHNLRMAEKLGCTEVYMGGSPPSLHDGLLRYKSKWAEGYCQPEGFISANMVMLLGWRRFEGAVEEFLSRTSIVFEEQGGFSALWAFPRALPLTAATLKQEHARLKARGLRRFCILLPGEAPVDFVCPPDVCLIPMSTLESGGVERLLHGPLPAASPLSHGASA